MQQCPYPVHKQPVDGNADTTLRYTHRNAGTARAARSNAGAARGQTDTSAGSGEYAQGYAAASAAAGFFKWKKV
ncbi:MAG: hypothetical protein F4Z82_06330 [Caldilineaceae bacterium SB0668_bin_21]|nr:hypothetical protein [Caldilineaceae bacterium SB0668_bin_21]MXX25045.1 hypothetical protein [Caldilineaceae bacterium SB0668_bin_21]